ncbi:uncharacterized protein LOC131884389 [Tigriopus californicus]|nr:uncharacterized protein LOC131884389 [Tigriopus californicus]
MQSQKRADMKPVSAISLRCIICFGCFLLIIPLCELKSMGRLLKDMHRGNQTYDDQHGLYNSSIFNSKSISEIWGLFMIENLNPSCIMVSDALTDQEEWKWVNLSFPFPFYDQDITSVGISEKGFISTSSNHGKAPNPDESLIAPLMANFESDTKLGGQVKYAEVYLQETGKYFLVQWINVTLIDQPELGPYSFQVILQENGDIVFLYHKISQALFYINNEFHPVRVGLSKALPHNSQIKSFQDLLANYQSPADLKKNRLIHITNNTSVIWQPLLACASFNSCETCLGGSIDPTRACQWCQEIESCSTGLDRNRDNWDQHQCSTKSVRDHCPQPLDEKAQRPIKETIIDDHDYYMNIIEPVSRDQFDKHWVKMDKEEGVTKLKSVSNMKIGAERVSLRLFPLTFYGHKLEKLFVTTEGFLSLAEELHDGIHALQYIAPLQANWDLSASNESEIRMLYDEERLTLEWAQVTLEHHPEIGSFTFQVSILANGDMVFVYKEVGRTWNQVDSPPNGSMFNKTFTVGISDAFEKNHFLYEYNRIDIDLSYIQPNAVIRFRARQTCNQLSSCHSCLTTNLPTFHCEWCPSLSTCSSGMDRLRENWESNQCHRFNVSNPSMCHLKSASKIKLSHDYYNTTTILDPDLVGQRLWVEGRKFKSVPFHKGTKVVLSFRFPFYGKPLHELFILPKEGIIALDSPPEEPHFMYASEIAPLNLDFEMDRLDPLSRVAYWDDGTQVVIEWRNVIMKTGGTKSMKVSFQVQLRYNGTIIFFYKSLPVSLQEAWVRKLGISDAYASQFSTPLDFLMVQPSKTEYHSISLKNQTSLISNETAIMIEPLLSCKDNYNCESCVEFSTKCQWCPQIGHCALFGFDKSHQKWIDNGCPMSYVSHNSSDTCPTVSPMMGVKMETEPMDVVYQSIADHHDYYKSVLSNDETVFKALRVGMKLDDPDVMYLSTTSNYFRQKDDVTLGFEFPFYGHYLRRIAVISAGFISIPSVERSNIIQSQYIAPLMADFDASSNENAYVLAKSIDTHLIVEWANMTIKSQPELGSFTFQAQLFPNGDINFVYIVIPCPLAQIDDEAHPLNVGLSDAYFMDHHSPGAQKMGLMQKRYIYHDLDLAPHLNQIINGTVIKLQALPTCNKFQSCWECTTGNTEFNCVWCPSLKLCSNGYDRNRQEWINGLCSLSHHSIKNTSHCPIEQIQSHHEYYNRTIHVNTLVEKQSIIRHMIHSDFNTFKTELSEPTEFLSFKLPFNFKFYGQEYEELLLSPLGFVTMFNEELQEEGIKNEIAPLRNISQVYIKTHPQVTLTYGANKDQFLALWNETSIPDMAFELVLKSSGDILFKYWNIPVDLDQHKYFVGIASTFPPTKSKPSQVYKINTEREHVVHGLTIMYELLEQCSDFQSCSDCVQHNCNWCHGSHACLSETIECSTNVSSIADLGSPQCSTSNSVFIFTLIGISAILVLTISTLIYHGWRHPASCPGQVLVHMRVTSHHCCHGAEPLHDGELWERRASIATTETTLSSLT